MSSTEKNAIESDCIDVLVTTLCHRANAPVDNLGQALAKQMLANVAALGVQDRAKEVVLVNT